MIFLITHRIARPPGWSDAARKLSPMPPRSSDFNSTYFPNWRGNRSDMDLLEPYTAYRRQTATRRGDGLIRRCRCRARRLAPPRLAPTSTVRPVAAPQVGMSGSGPPEPTVRPRPASAGEGWRRGGRGSGRALLLIRLQRRLFASARPDLALELTGSRRSA